MKWRNEINFCKNNKSKNFNSRIISFHDNLSISNKKNKSKC